MSRGEVARDNPTAPSTTPATTIDDNLPIVRKLTARGCNTRQDIIDKNNLAMFDVPGDGNCGHSSIVIGSGRHPAAFHNLATSVPRMTEELWEHVKVAKSKTLEVLQDPVMCGMLQAVRQRSHRHDAFYAFYY